MMSEKITNIGPVNYYGGLRVMEKDGKFYWDCENYDMAHWDEISESSYRKLIEVENLENPENI